MTFGHMGKSGVRTSKLEDSQLFLDVFFEYGHTEIDTARLYAEGTSEKVRNVWLHSQYQLAESPAGTIAVGFERSCSRYQVRHPCSTPEILQTSDSFRAYPVEPGDHRPAILRKTLLTSLECLGMKKVRVFYLHAPDRSVPFENTVREVNALHKEGLL
jgi:aflatoxin B1 aldehyde reductase